MKFCMGMLYVSQYLPNVLRQESAIETVLNRRLVQTIQHGAYAKQKKIWFSPNQARVGLKRGGCASL